MRSYPDPRRHGDHRIRLTAVLLCSTCIGVAVGQTASDSLPPQATSATPQDEPGAAAYGQAVAKAIAFLRTQQAEDGGYATAADPGATALITAAAIQHNVPLDDPLVAKSLAYLERFVQPDGGIYRPGTYYRNYETCLGIMCFTQANGSRKYSQVIREGLAFVKEIQWGTGDETDPSDPAYGGAGYGKHGRPDLSNTQYLLDALHAAGDADNIDAIERALVFVSRCQNLESKYNDTDFPRRNPDGGFYYSAAAGGSSQAGNTPNGGLRSYGSMSYAGLKSMIYAGVSRDDERVKAVTAWIRKHYTLEENPGLGQAGLYYYYQTFAKALDAVGEAEFVDEQGVVHDWREELRAKLFANQQPNGSWANEQDRWYEGDPKLVTGYSLLTLLHCRP